MATSSFLLLLLLAAVTTTTAAAASGHHHHHEPTTLLLHMVQLQSHVSHARNWLINHNNHMLSSFPSSSSSSNNDDDVGVAIRDCAKLYEESESRLSEMMNNNYYYNNNYSREKDEGDGVTWISAVMTNHRTCLDGLEEKGHLQAHQALANHNFTLLLREALHSYANNKKNKPKRGGPPAKGNTWRRSYSGLLASWSRSTSEADFRVAQDGSGSHETIGEAIQAVASMGHNRPERVIIHVKSGVYKEKVEIGYKLKNIMLVGDGIDETIITGSRSVAQGSTTLASASFDVSGDGFWARDLTFENTAGPEKHQAVAIKVSSDRSVFYRCSFKAYQDTLYVHSNRQFYRDSIISGTIDFIFGDASVIFQNCDILVRKPMSHQSNFITAQGRDDPNQPTGISIQNSRVRPSSDLAPSKGQFRTYLGRPWKKYSRTVFLRSDLDGLIDPRGWGEWSGNFGISTLYYGEYMNTGSGASVEKRVNWPGFHVLRGAGEARPFSVDEFLNGDQWIPATGVPFSDGI